MQIEATVEFLLMIFSPSYQLSGRQSPELMPPLSHRRTIMADCQSTGRVYMIFAKSTCWNIGICVTVSRSDSRQPYLRIEPRASYGDVDNAGGVS